MSKKRSSSGAAAAAAKKKKADDGEVWVNPDLDRILKGEDAALGRGDRDEAVNYWVSRKTRQPLKNE